MNGGNTWIIFVVLGLCIGIALIAFIAAVYLTRKSGKDAQHDIQKGLEEITSLLPAIILRIDKLDQLVIDSFQPLSKPAGENFSLAKQFLNLIEDRKQKIESLLESKRLENLFRAQKIITSPLENAGDHLTSVVFSNTVLRLEPGQFQTALNAMLNSVEQELAGNPVMETYRGRDEFGHRRRRFTIRGFIQSVTKNAEDEEKK